MKKINLYLMLAAVAGMAASCAEENFNSSAEGKLALSTTLNENVEVVSRAYDAESLKESCEIWISNSKGLVRRYKGVSEVPASIDLVGGAYIAEAWAGDSVSASFDKRCYKGYQEFDIKGGQTTTVALECKIANVVASVNYPENIDRVFSEYTMTIGHSRGTLDFIGNEKAKGYFMMPSTDKELAYTLRGKLITGDNFELSGTIPDAKPATWYVLNVEYHATPQEYGGALFTIVVDKNELTIEDKATVKAAPRFSGYGFELSETISGEAKSFGRKCVYIASVNDISSLVINSESFTALIPSIGGNDFDVFSEDISAAVVEAVNNAGINWSKNEVENGTLVQLNFEEEFTNLLTDGLYEFELVATDSENLRSRTTLSFNVSDAKVEAKPIVDEDISFTSATLRGVVIKDGIESVGFRYRKAGSSDWTDVEATPLSRALMAGTSFEATVTGLERNSAYEYCATFDGVAANVLFSFQTDAVPVLPNAGFEDWGTSGKVVLIAPNESSMFWDSGNHGSATMSVNITSKEDKIKHSGNYSAKLRSQFVGVGTIGKFAAGNLFIGKYLDTDGTDGILGWGRPIDFKHLPKAIKCWVKYTPGLGVSKKGAVNGYIGAGESDQGIVYFALTDDTDTGKTEYKNEKWAVVINTKTSQLFSKTDANVVAYGEQIFSEATAGDGLIEVTIPFEYFKSNKPTRIIFVASASRYGDYFSGGEGSTMYIDDIELIYE